MTNSPEYIEARQTWWDKRDLYKKELNTATHFYELEKSLFLADRLNPDDSDGDKEYGILEDALLDAQLKVLEVCYDFAKKKSSLDLARREMDDAKEKFEAVNFQELQKSEEVKS